MLLFTNCFNLFSLSLLTVFYCFGTLLGVLQGISICVSGGKNAKYAIITLFHQANILLLLILCKTS